MCLATFGRVMAITDAERRLATVEIDGACQEIALLLLVDEDHPIETWVGAWVAIHVGFALRRVDAAEVEALARLLVMP